MQQKSISFTPRQWEELRKEAAIVGVTISEYLRRLVDAAKELRKQLVNQ